MKVPRGKGVSVFETNIRVCAGLFRRSDVLQVGGPLGSLRPVQGAGPMAFRSPKAGERPARPGGPAGPTHSHGGERARRHPIHLWRRSWRTSISLERSDFGEAVAVRAWPSLERSSDSACVLIIMMLNCGLMTQERLEMRYLSHATGDDVFAAKTMKFYVPKARRGSPPGSEDTVQGMKSLDGCGP